MNYFVFLQAKCHESTDKYYMSLLDIILLAVALAMDCLTLSVVSGVIGFTVYSLQFTDDYTDGSEGLASKSTVNCKPSTVNIRMAFLFGFFQALMPLIGWAGISHFQSYMEAYDHWIAFLLLGFIGGRMVWESFHPEEGQHFNPRRLQTQLLLAIATSIDALAVGISFACTGYEQLSQLWMPLAVIGMVSFLFSLLGYWAGYHFGRGIISRFKPELIGGVILILIGVRILMSHLGYI
jgi:putative Mn2+ efflux pump MntP